MNPLLHKVLFGRFGREVAWNIGSLLALAISGVFLNVLIGWAYGPEILGVFNQVYAVYILLSQLAASGAHFSVLKHVSQFQAERDKLSPIISSALFLTALTATVVTLLGFPLSGLAGLVLRSPLVKIGLMYALPGLLFFALNKVLLALLNGKRQMKPYAVFSGLRYILLLGFLVAGFLLKLKGTSLPFIFSASEITLFFPLFFYTLKFYSFVKPSLWDGWVKEHFFFGLRALPSGALSDINTRVDVLMLGIFTTDRIVGVYSLAAMLAEGLVQLTVAVRANVNPILSSLFFQQGVLALQKTVRWGIRMFYLAMAAVGIFAIIVYPVLIYLFLDEKVFMASWPVFSVLTVGIILGSGYLPFSMLLNQAGYPGRHTLTIAAKALSNVLFNALLIPFLGMYGAAIATAISFVLNVVILKVLVKKTLKISI